MQHVPARFASYDVVIPCHNRAHVVADAVESVLAQVHAPGKVIVVDDGSSDASPTVIRALAATHDRVQAVILPRNVGASQARNSGVALATAEWVAFLDSDDVWLPGAAQTLLAPAATAGHDIVVGHFARIEGDAPPTAPECGWDGGCIAAGLMSGGVIGPSWSVVRRNLVERVHGFDPSFHNCNDWDFYTRAAAAGARFTRLDTCVAHYRTVAGSRLVNDTAIGERNGRRVLAHAYFDAYRAPEAISA
ncbi:MULTISPECIES: glycosyltransferase family 2 protein [unclassified Sphingomonas]|uniref:glycosyltransferase family 2 protein n=1 Tax=unclassified Sphingomonas TaxID=196159 RepID=UPI0006FD1B1B|nr:MULTISPECIES: glycosyltransferase family 2 protein [unclassified Sphingomonas]KQM64767.1 family 2 glycosyl transferase [Sphingomonas sp. Leaf16]KQN16900.1 family 2 glycosyl transferase [Sphingomonas sp. Leaf29]KQN22881.1 family 2 glycosyl transferase [Sphingomonas sp. Leaf32]